MLPPLQYKVESMKVVQTGDEVGDPTTIDLSNPNRVQTETLEDEENEDGEAQEYEYNTMLKQAYHSEPKFSVTQKGSDDGHFGIDKYKLIDKANGDINITNIYEVNEETGDITYNYGGAIFVKDDKYTFKLSGYEEYTNADNGKVSQVPMSGVVVTINNALSTSAVVYVEDGTVNGEEVVAGDVASLKSNQIALDDNGSGTYTWFAGYPNIAGDFTRTISMTYDIGGRSYQWSGSGLKGIVLGDLPTGNNFITSGPDRLTMILRDPPGSDSSAEWSSGTSVAETTVKGSSFSEGFEANNTLKFGFTQGTIVGTPATGTISTSDSADDLTNGVSQEYESESSKTISTSTTITTTVATKGAGDVFIGTATNIIFGNARMLNFQRKAADSQEVELGLKDILTTGMSFGTTFNYSQTYIEETLIPNWEKMRGKFLQHVDDASTIDSYVNTTNKPVYLTTLTEDDEDFGQNDTYTMVLPQTMATGTYYADSILYINDQIKNWINYLALNEKEKVMAYEKRDLLKSLGLMENYSFDAGADVNWSMEKDSTDVTSFEWSCTIGGSISNTTGTDVSGFGFEFEQTASA
ncbi:MAG: hypothetical protein ACSW8D_16180, partial [Prevotella sp.]